MPSTFVSEISSSTRHPGTCSISNCAIPNHLEGRGKLKGRAKKNASWFRIEMLASKPHFPVSTNSFCKVYHLAKRADFIFKCGMGHSLLTTLPIAVTKMLFVFAATQTFGHPHDYCNGSWDSYCGASAENNPRTTYPSSATADKNVSFLHYMVINCRKSMCPPP